MISIREEIAIAMPPEVSWPLLSDPAIVASCIPGAVLTKAGEDGVYQGTAGEVRADRGGILRRGQTRL